MRINTALMFVLLMSVSLVASAQGRETQQSALAEITADSMGESLKVFLSRHKEASCHRRQSEEVEERKKTEWLAWVDCGFEKRATVPLTKRLMAANTVVAEGHTPIWLLGMFASFHDSKLVEIGYTLDAKSLDHVLQFMDGWGEPSRSSFTKEGEFQSATWMDKTGVAITVEVVSLPPITADGQFLRIEKGTGTRGIQMRYVQTGEQASGF